MIAEALCTAAANICSRRMLNDESSRITVAPAAASLAALRRVKKGRVKARTIRRIARQRSINSRISRRVRRRIVRCGTWRTKVSAGNSILRARVRRTRCTSIGAATAAMPNQKSGLRNHIGETQVDSVDMVDSVDLVDMVDMVDIVDMVDCVDIVDI